MSLPCTDLSSILALSGFFFVIILIFIGIGLTISILFLLTIQNTLKEIKSTNRTVEPSNVWLMLIPIFNYIYGFILYPKISQSLKNEFEFRGLTENGDFGRSLGMALPILSLISFVPIIGGIAGFANLIIWIIYWAKISALKNTLINSQVGNKYGFNSRQDTVD